MIWLKRTMSLEKKWPAEFRIDYMTAKVKLEGHLEILLHGHSKFSPRFLFLLTISLPHDSYFPISFSIYSSAPSLPFLLLLLFLFLLLLLHEWPATSRTTYQIWTFICLTSFKSMFPEQILPPVPQKEPTQISTAWFLGFLPPELWNNKLLLSATQTLMFCYGSRRKVIHTRRVHRWGSH